MRVLICDQESEMLETVARSFEVDIATSKATCIDLMRANSFDVLVASERLSDGSGLELLSHVATRWPDTLRVLVIEPARLKLLRGKLGPFRLHATLRYPIDEDELEAVLNELQALLGTEEEEPDPAPPVPEARSPPSPPARPAPPAAAPARAMPRPAARPVTPPSALKVQRVQLPPSVRPGSSPNTRAAPAAPAPSIPGRPVRPSGTRSPSMPAAPTARPAPGSGGASRAPASQGPGGSPRSAPVRRRLGNYTPLGAPEDEQLRIVEREFDQTVAPLAARAIRNREEANRPRTPREKVSSLAAQVRQTLRRLLKR